MLFEGKQTQALMSISSNCWQKKKLETILRLLGLQGYQKILRCIVIKINSCSALFLDKNNPILRKNEGIKPRMLWNMISHLQQTSTETTDTVATGPVPSALWFPGPSPTAARTPAAWPAGAVAAHGRLLWNIGNDRVLASVSRMGNDSGRLGGGAHTHHTLKRGEWDLKNAMQKICRNKYNKIGKCYFWVCLFLCNVLIIQINAFS